MIIDCHNHILSAGEYPGYEKFIKEMTLGYFRSLGRLPVDRMPVENDWLGLEYLRTPTGPGAIYKRPSRHRQICYSGCRAFGLYFLQYTRVHRYMRTDTSPRTAIHR